ncbi:MAG: serine/threonine-protein kinase [Archangium sp.]|nr:serine/threonine-protein kinase [Archangium sp.]MDP3152282.1 serine/threonine-protein kinase [Archangium sp.]MDP3570678.1 serine/threonine-protein kinase [Archangium sp.]
MADPSRYRAVQKIADGGSAEVFLAEQLGAAGFKRLVVLKRIRPELYADAQYREMLIEEAQLAMSLHHSNLVEVLDVGEANGRYFLVMELVDGWTLHQIMRRARDAGMPLPPELAVYITAELCRALAYAHLRSEGGEPLHIVHRDVCPNNVLISMHAEVKLTDFGIAKARTRTAHTKIGMIKGKPAFMSPEQTRAEPLDARSDLFSVGTVLYALLTDKLPFPGPSDQELLIQVSNADVPSPDKLKPELPKEVCKLVLKAMAKKRENRFSSAQEMLGALEQVQRSALKPAGRSELENFLRTLSAKDGATAITRQTMPPAANEEAEWIALSAEQSIVPDQTATQRAMPHFVPPPAPSLTRRPRKPSRWPVAVGVLALLGVVAWWSLGRRHEPLAPVVKVEVDAGAPVVVAVSEPVVEDAGTIVDSGPEEFVELPAIDAGLLEVGDPEPVVSPPVEVVSRSGVPGLKLSARLAPNQKPGSAMVAVLVESEPSGVVIKVDKRELGKTPATLHFKNGLTFDVWFEAKGKKPLRQWLMLTERPGKPTKVTLRAPADD